MKLSDIFNERQQLNENPRLSASVDFSFLTNENENRTLAKEILETGEMRFGNDETALYMKGDTLALIDKSIPRIIFYVQKEPDFDDTINREYVRQGVIWRDKNYKITQGMAKDVFWKVLLTEYGTVMTDWDQSEDGKNFWFRRVEEALAMPNCYVYFISSSPELVIEVKSMNDLHEMNSKYGIWTSNDRSEHKRIFITTIPTDEIMEE